MSKTKTNPDQPKAPRKPRTISPEIERAKKECAEMWAEAETKHREIMTAARTAARVRKLTENMSDSQREALKSAL